MNPYTRLYRSLLDYCDRGPGSAFGYTVAMLALGAGACLNLLSILNVLWALRLLQAPYGRGSVHPAHYVYALLYVAFLANTILARLQCAADRRLLALMPEAALTSSDAQQALTAGRPGIFYVLGTGAVFVITLALGLLRQR